MARSADKLGNEPQKTRAAIYTRVSTDDSLGMEFNSLDAQREACQAYIASQRHEGWEELPARYDDGGYSGGTLKRPALAQLLVDVRAGRVDTIVVYKIDRLTRSLADFSRIVDVLDSHGASFISITQAFSTTTSMGRLTLNVLLSFAQFEREVGAERVRDKIASSKKKGMWMGGVVPLGYDVHDRKLVVNPAEAETIRTMFERYVALRSAVKLREELSQSGIVSKRHVGKSGQARGGTPFSRGGLYNLLQNVTYIGKVAHRGENYDGQHQPIIEAALFDQAQAILAQNRADRRHGTRARQQSLLAGLVFDARGEPLTPAHTTRKSKRYRYYCAKELGEGGGRIFRVPAGDLERLVITQIRGWLEDPHTVESSLAGARLDAVALEALLFTAARIAGELGSVPPPRLRELLMALIERAVIAEEQLTITLRIGGIFTLAGLPIPKASFEPVTLTTSCQLVRRSREVRLAVVPQHGGDQAHVDPSLIKLLVKAHAARAALFAGEGASIADVAATQGYDPHYFAVLVKLSYLAPDLTKAILQGRQPLRLDRQALARIRKLPICWDEQRRLLSNFGSGY